MRICYLVVQWPKGSEAFIAVDLRALIRAGHQVDVKAMRGRPDGAGAMLASRGLSGIRSSWARPSDLLVALRHWRMLMAVATLALRARGPGMLASLALAPRAVAMAAEVLRERPDVVHAFWGHYPALPLALLGRAAGRTTTISTSLIAYDLEQRPRIGLLTARRVADIAFTHAEVNRAVLHDLGVAPERLHVVRAGVDPAWLVPGPDAPAKRDDVLLSVGRLIPDKGHDQAIRVLAALRRSTGAAMRLRILGGGPDLARLRGIARDEGVADAVEFAGHVAHERVRAELLAATFVILLSRYAGERLPNVVKEAMACGCICITTPTPGIAELVGHGRTGWVVDPSDHAAAAAAIAGMIGQPDAITAMAAAARKHIDAAFNADRQQRAYAERWSGIRAGQGGRA